MENWSRYTFRDAIEHQRRNAQQQDSHETKSVLKITGLTDTIKNFLDSSKILQGLEFPRDFYLLEGQKKIEAFATAKKSFIESMAHQFFVNAALGGYEVEVYLRPQQSRQILGRKHQSTARSRTRGASSSSKKTTPTAPKRKRKQQESSSDDASRQEKKKKKQTKDVCVASNCVQINK